MHSIGSEILHWGIYASRANLPEVPGGGARTLACRVETPLKKDPYVIDSSSTTFFIILCAPRRMPTRLDTSAKRRQDCRRGTRERVRHAGAAVFDVCGGRWILRSLGAGFHTPRGGARSSPLRLRSQSPGAGVHSRAIE